MPLLEPQWYWLTDGLFKEKDWVLWTEVCLCLCMFKITNIFQVVRLSMFNFAIRRFNKWTLPIFIFLHYFLMKRRIRSWRKCFYISLYLSTCRNYIETREASLLLNVVFLWPLNSCLWLVETKAGWSWLVVDVTWSQSAQSELYRSNWKLTRLSHHYRLLTVIIFPKYFQIFHTNKYLHIRGQVHCL